MKKEYLYLLTCSEGGENKRLLCELQQRRADGREDQTLEGKKRGLRRGEMRGPNIDFASANVSIEHSGRISEPVLQVKEK